MVAVAGNATTGQPSHNPTGRPSEQRYRYLDVPCPSCGARVGETCTRAKGERAFRPHALRRENSKRKQPATWWGTQAEMLDVPAVLISWYPMERPDRGNIQKAAARTAAKLWPDHHTTVREADMPELTDYASGEPCGKVYRVILRSKTEA
jgi:hypothetical protein